MVLSSKMYESLAGRTVRLLRAYTVEEDCLPSAPFKFSICLPKGLRGTVIKVVMIPESKVFVDFSIGETKIQCWIPKLLTELVK